MAYPAVIEGDHIVIRIPLAELPGIVENAGDARGKRLELVDDSDWFPHFVVGEINNVEEDGGTLVDRMLDVVVWALVDGEYDGIAVKRDPQCDCQRPPTHCSEDCPVHGWDNGIAEE